MDRNAFETTVELETHSFTPKSSQTTGRYLSSKVVVIVPLSAIEADYCSLILNEETDGLSPGPFKSKKKRIGSFQPRSQKHQSGERLVLDLLGIGVIPSGKAMRLSGQSHVKILDNSLKYFP